MAEGEKQRKTTRKWEAKAESDLSKSDNGSSQTIQGEKSRLDGTSSLQIMTFVRGKKSLLWSQIDISVPPMAYLKPTKVFNSSCRVQGLNQTCEVVYLVSETCPRENWFKPGTNSEAPWLMPPATCHIVPGVNPAQTLRCFPWVSRNRFLKNILNAAILITAMSNLTPGAQSRCRPLYNHKKHKTSFKIRPLSGDLPTASQ